MTGSILQFFSLLGLHFLAFWPCGPSFPCILALWVFISLRFGLLGFHFLSFWPCGPSFPCILAFSGSASGVSPHKLPKMARLPNVLIMDLAAPWPAPFCSFLGLVGLHFLAFWPCGPSFPCILALWAFISLHFGLVGLHFLAFWPCGPSFPCILALWAFISLHFGLFGVGFWAPLPQVAKNCPFAQRPYNGFSSAVTGSILQFFSLLGLHFLAFWPCGPSFPCILALMGLHFLAFWPFGLSFPFMFALWAFISLHFGLFGVSFWGPPHKLPKIARLPNVLTMDLAAP